MEYLKKYYPGRQLENEGIKAFAAEGDALFEQSLTCPWGKGNNLTWRVKSRKQFVPA
jgi:hypothetical protein